MLVNSTDLLRSREAVVVRGDVGHDGPFIWHRRVLKIWQPHASNIVLVPCDVSVLFLVMLVFFETIQVTGSVNMN